MENPFEIILEKIDRLEYLITEFIDKKKAVAEIHENGEEIINMNQACKILGLSKPTLYGYTAKRKIPHYKRGKRNYFKKSELIKWISDGKVKTMDEIQQDVESFLSKPRRKRKH